MITTFQTDFFHLYQESISYNAESYYYSGFSRFLLPDSYSNLARLEQ